ERVWRAVLETLPGAARSRSGPHPGRDQGRRVWRRGADRGGVRPARNAELDHLPLDPQRQANDLPGRQERVARLTLLSWGRPVVRAQEELIVTPKRTQWWLIAMALPVVGAGLAFLTA